MKTCKRVLATVLAMALLICCAVTGLVLPASAEGDTFMLEMTELYLAPPTSGYVVYYSIPVVTPTGEDYTETITWKSSKTSVATINSTSGLIETKAVGVTVITATNAAGESHTCELTVAWDGEIVSGGHFESKASWNVKKWTTEIVKSGAAEVVEDPDDPTNHVLKVPAGMATKYHASLAVKPGKTYMLSCDVKGEMTGPTNEIKALYISNSTSNGWKYVFPVKDEWRHYSWTFTTSSSVNRNYVIGLANQNISSGSNTNPYYIDNISVVELGTATAIELSSTALDLEIGESAELSVAPTPADATFNRVVWSTNNDQVATVDKNGKITAVAPGVATITATSAKLTATCEVTVHEEMLAAVPDAGLTDGTIAVEGGAFGEVQPDDVVSVTVTPKDGYLMIPGSLRYTDKAGKTVYVLNKDFEDGATFGQGDGNTFKLVMPDEKVTLTADFISTAEQNFAANTIGTSCRYTVDGAGEKVYDGIRFLTRLNLANKFDAESDTLTVTYGGKEYTVLELGSLLKREGSSTALTYENAVANEQVAGANRMWISRAYTKDSGVFKLVDYTESYIDFTSVMLTSHFDRFYTARGYIRMQDTEGSVETLEFDEIENSISSVVPILPPVQELEGVTVGKTNWTPLAHTVEPGQKLKYTITVKAGAQGGPVTVFEPIPENTVYVEGADRLVGKTAVWELELAANEEKELTYTVQVKDNMDLCEGGKVVSTATQVGNTTLDIDETLYIERSVSKFDEYYVNNVIRALGDATIFKELGLVYRVEYSSYTTAHTAFRRDSGYNGLTGAAVLDAVIRGDGVASYTYTNTSNKATEGTIDLLDMIAPTLYGGASVKGQIEGVKGAPAALVSERDLMIGDVVIVKNDGTVSMYIYCDRGLLLLKPTGGTEKAELAILDTLTQSEEYLVLRWRAGLKSATSTDPETLPVELTPEQEAVIKTGESFLMRGEKVQYADTSLAQNADYRWAIEQVSPEDATAINWKYTNCAAFCYDSYYFGLNYKLGGGNLYTTANMAKNTTMRLFNLSRTVADTFTEEEKATLKEQWMNTLQPGDLMVVRRSSGSGHVMMYIGNGKMIHSTGANYNYTYSREFYEPSIAYGQVENYFFNPGSLSGYIFGDAEQQDTTQVIQACIIRPLSKFTGEVPENTVNRLNKLKGVVAQKVASHAVAKTVTAGDTITYTYNIRNTNQNEIVLEVKDVVPANTTYVSGAEVVDGDNLSWTVTVPADATREVSFTVKVNEDAVTGTLIQSTAGTVGGVSFKVRDITVANTLTAEQQEAVKAAFDELVAEGTTLREFELINEVYKRALGVENVFESTDALVIATDETDGVFDATGITTTPFKVATSGKYREMMVPTLYGGRKVDSNLWDANRTRLPKVEHVVVGDVLIYRTSSSTIIYFYTGERFVKLSSGITNDTASTASRLAYTLAVGNYFTVLRPSMTMNTTEVTE